MSIQWTRTDAHCGIEGPEHYDGEVFRSGPRPHPDYHERFHAVVDENLIVTCAACGERVFGVGGVCTEHHEALEDYAEMIGRIIGNHYFSKHRSQK